tara:strand:- start:35 stop:334 length:300 start_codon:yes stop_codon:yes gene_type:complete
MDQEIREKFEQLVTGAAFHNKERQLLYDFKEEIKKIYGLKDTEAIRKIAHMVYTEDDFNNNAYSKIRDFIKKGTKPHKKTMKKIQTLVNLIQELKGNES